MVPACRWRSRPQHQLPTSREPPLSTMAMVGRGRQFRELGPLASEAERSSSRARAPHLQGPRRSGRRRLQSQNHARLACETAPVGNESPRRPYRAQGRRESAPLPAAPWTLVSAAAQTAQTRRAPRRRPATTAASRPGMRACSRRRSARPPTPPPSVDPPAVHLPYRERCVSAGDEQKDRSMVEAPQEPAILGPLERRVAKQRRASEHAEQRQEIDRAGQDQPWPSAICREAEQDRGRDQRQQQPERVDAPVEFEFPIGVVGFPARQTHVRLKRTVPQQFQHLRFREKPDDPERPPTEAHRGEPPVSSVLSATRAPTPPPPTLLTRMSIPRWAATVTSIRRAAPSGL